MKQILSVVITIFLWVAVYTQTPVPPGPISGTWTGDGSPYLIEGVNTIEDGTTLIINPGVVVEWQNDSCPMWVNGRIVAEGTESDSITFTALDPETGWGSIRFDDTPTSNDTSIFKYCHFEHGKVFGDIPDNSGGALALLNTNKVIISHCYFLKNKADDISVNPIPIGGAIALLNASPIISNCLFKDNECYAGGAIGCYLGSHPEIYNNIFTNNDAIGYNYAQGYGGAICLYVSCSPTISYNTFSSNTAGNGGGAIGMVSQCNPTIDHNLICHNTSEWLGGGIEVQDTCSPSIVNNTIIYNTADYGGGIDFWDQSNAMIRNTILWGNTAPNGNQVNLKDSNCVPDFEYCDIEGGQEAFGGVPHTGKYLECFDQDPLFNGPPNYYITWANAPVEDSTKSPCIDHGCPTMKDPDSTRCDVGYCYFDQWWQGVQEPFTAEDLNMEIFPNPTSGKLDIRYAISDIRSVTIEVFDLSGKQLKQLIVETWIPGEQTVKVNVSELPDGLYLLILTTGNESVCSKLLIRH